MIKAIKRKRHKPVILERYSGFTRKQWEEMRRKYAMGPYLGGSDTGTILGLVGSPLKLIRQKRGEIPWDDLSNNDKVQLGNELEPWVIKQLTKQTGLKVRQRYCLFQHPEYPWMTANTDGDIVGHPGCMNETKTITSGKVRSYYGQTLSDQIPPYTYSQIQHYLAVLDYDTCVVSAYFLGIPELRFYVVKRNDEFIKHLIEEEYKFIELFKAGKNPEVDGSSVCTQMIKDMFPEVEHPEFIPANDVAKNHAVEVRRLKLQKEKVERELKMHENSLKNMVGPFGGIQGICSWKEVNSKNGTYRRFSLT